MIPLFVDPDLEPESPLKEPESELPGSGSRSDTNPYQDLDPTLDLNPPQVRN